jgi:hypothetical protein
MALYPINILRCQHIKVNGTQCGSPALRDATHCYYHIRYHWPELEALPNNNEWRIALPTLEDANSIQVALAKVMEQLVLNEIDHKTAALMLYALQTASMNLKRTSLEPKLPTQVVIDRQSVARRPLGASAWSRVEGQEYDDLAVESDANANANSEANSKSNGTVVKSLQASIPTARRSPSRSVSVDRRGARRCKVAPFLVSEKSEQLFRKEWRGRRDSNSRPLP